MAQGKGSRWVLSMVLLASAMGARADPPPQPQPGIKWSDEQIKRAAPVRIARSLEPATWPGHARVAVCLSFDVDNESYMLVAGETSANKLSAGDYGAATGLPRILAILDHHKVPATFFIPAASAILHPQMIPAILRNGHHEIGVHGWFHESLPDLPSAAEEERLLDQAIRYLTEASGKRPQGYRAPGWAFSAHTMDLIWKKKLAYDSSLMAMDEPYEIQVQGSATGMVELPVDWTLTETPYLSLGGTMPSPEQLFRLYRAEFDGAYRDGSIFVLTLHPHVSGHHAPAHELDQLIAYMKSKPGVWFATGAEIAAYVKSATPRAQR